MPFATKVDELLDVVIPSTSIVNGEEPKPDHSRVQHYIG